MSNPHDAIAHVDRQTAGVDGDAADGVALGPDVEQGTTGYLAAAGLLALLVAAVHLVLELGRVGTVSTPTAAATMVES